MIDGQPHSCPRDGAESLRLAALRAAEAWPRALRLRVLIVEDNPDTRDMLKMLLAMWGQEVRVAATGAQGLQVATAFRPDVAVIDIGLPELDGYEVARRIRNEFGAGVRLIALTAYGQPGDRRRSIAAGFDVHLVKPCPSDELKRAILTPGSIRPAL
jgi:CheY-like chemotaxis protein